MSALPPKADIGAINVRFGPIGSATGAAELGRARAGLSVWAVPSIRCNFWQRYSPAFGGVSHRANLALQIESAGDEEEVGVRKTFAGKATS